MSFVNIKARVNKKLLPIKAHYFFFNAGTAPLVPYLSTYARQLGFSSTTVGLIYAILPISGLIAKPLFGVIADRFKLQKALFLLFQIVTILSFGAIYFIPGEQNEITVGLDCNYGATVLSSCFDDIDSTKLCQISNLKYHNQITQCKMNCDMTSPKMWQTVCEHWHIPKYCYSNTDNIEFTTHLDKVTRQGDCGYISAVNVTLDGYSYTPGCRTGKDYVVIDEPCKMHCVNAELTKALGSENINITCKNNMVNYRSCKNASQLEMLSNNSLHTSSCEIYCQLDKSAPWKLMEICEGWNADDADSCHPRTESGGKFPSNLSFTGAVRTSTIMEHQCVFLELNHIILSDGQIRYPYCLSKTRYGNETDLFQTTCQVSCDNEQVNEIFVGAIGTKKVETSQYTRQFWLFFMMMIISWIGQAVVVTFADAICFNLIGTNVSRYGKQRLWGSLGWGIFSLLTGTLIDLFSYGSVKNYAIAFILMLVFMTGDVVVSSFLKIDSTKISASILADVGTLVSSLPTLVYLMWTIAVGMCTGLQWNFLFWLIEDVMGDNPECTSSDYGKTLQGLVSAIQTFCGEIPFLFVSGYLLRKVGHVNMMSLILFTFGIRFILYSFLTNAWWVLPIEILQGITSGMFYPTMTSYASIVSPPGTETTVQGLVGAVFEGVGTSLGSYIGGQLYKQYGGSQTFSWFGYGSLVCCIIHSIGQHIIRIRNASAGERQGYTTVIHYEKPTDMVSMLVETHEATGHDT